ncbi:hypothetical protein BCR33DRAFT_779474 [Rhizoclosmatium globosum]|uniref:Uncharacterized protein n=1 Tax=Rhizoclosmatium globosum TaxID=329046 RepID=A0A1Y2D1H7_9FUNG|nr:hypothetical protein BCR33DRAFT_779474 [Rhizoclosmatium globosum]|eukprot:ORY53141.1 hypothetical protein BCR33DRAFT_779474 [Rhizoclosmatium globosum]
MNLEYAVHKPQQLSAPLPTTHSSPPPIQYATPTSPLSGVLPTNDGMSQTTTTTTPLHLQTPRSVTGCREPRHGVRKGRNLLSTNEVRQDEFVPSVQSVDVISGELREKQHLRKDSSLEAPASTLLGIERGASTTTTTTTTSHGKKGAEGLAVEVPLQRTSFLGICTPDGNNANVGYGNVTNRVATLRTLDFNCMREEADAQQEILVRMQETLRLLDFFECLIIDE